MWCNIEWYRWPRRKWMAESTARHSISEKITRRNVCGHGRDRSSQQSFRTFIVCIVSHIDGIRLLTCAILFKMEIFPVPSEPLWAKKFNPHWSTIDGTGRRFIRPRYLWYASFHCRFDSKKWRSFIRGKRYVEDAWGQEVSHSRN